MRVLATAVLSAAVLWPVPATARTPKTILVFAGQDMRPWDPSPLSRMFKLRGPFTVDARLQVAGTKAGYVRDVLVLSPSLHQISVVNGTYEPGTYYDFRPGDAPITLHQRVSDIACIAGCQIQLFMVRNARWRAVVTQ